MLKSPENDQWLFFNDLVVCTLVKDSVEDVLAEFNCEIYSLLYEIDATKTMAEENSLDNRLSQSFSCFSIKDLPKDDDMDE